MPYCGASVDESTKEGWEEYMRESDYGSMSELIRCAVRAEINGESGTSGASREVTIDLDSVQERQQTILSRLDDLSEGVSEVAESQEAEYPEAVVELAHRLSNDIQAVSPEEWERLEAGPRTDLEAMAVNYLGSAETPDVTKVQAALRYLEESVPWIEAPPKGPSDYYRVED